MADNIDWEEERGRLIIWKDYVQINHILIGLGMFLILSYTPVSQTHIVLVWWRIETQVISEEEQQGKDIAFKMEQSLAQKASRIPLPGWFHVMITLTLALVFKPLTINGWQRNR